MDKGGSLMRRAALQLYLEQLKLMTRIRQPEYSYVGFYRGAVAANDDPEKLGRVRVRIPAIHGTEESTATNNLPWAEVVSMGGGTDDCGSYEPPIIGARVLVVFEQGHPRLPLIVSTFRSKPTVTPSVKSPGSKVFTPTKTGNEKPVEITGAEDTISIWRKSWKGHTIICEDKDQAEFIRIIDRGGNIIELTSPMYGEAKRRGAGNAIDGGEQSPTDMTGESHILLKDISGQEIRMKVDPANPEITLTTNGKIKLGGITAALGLAIGTLLKVALDAFATTVQAHTHISAAPGSLTGPAIGVGNISDSSLWTTKKTVVEPLEAP